MQPVLTQSTETFNSNNDKMIDSVFTLSITNAVYSNYAIFFLIHPRLLRYVYKIPLVKLKKKIQFPCILPSIT